MHRAFIRNFEQLGSLFGGELANKMNVQIDAIEHCLFLFAIGAIRRVYLGVPQIDSNFLERPSLPAERTSPPSSKCRLPRRLAEVRRAMAQYPCHLRTWARRQSSDAPPQEFLARIPWRYRERIPLSRRSFQACASLPRVNCPCQLLVVAVPFTGGSLQTQAPQVPLA